MFLKSNYVFCTCPNPFHHKHLLFLKNTKFMFKIFFVNSILVIITNQKYCKGVYRVRSNSASTDI